MALLSWPGPTATGWVARLLLGTAMASAAPQPAARSGALEDNPDRLDATAIQAHALAGLTILGQDGLPLRLGSHPGRLLLIQFWGSWCDYSRADLPELVALARDLGARITVVLVSSRQDDAANRAWAAEHAIGLPQDVYAAVPHSLAVEAQIGRATAGRFEETVPVTAIFLPSGALAQSYVGARAWSNPVVERELVGLLDLEQDAP
jgi:thiol-disulfide isomerase/thioredoxin